MYSDVSKNDARPLVTATPPLRNPEWDPPASTPPPPRTQPLLILIPPQPQPVATTATTIAFYSSSDSFSWWAVSIPCSTSRCALHVPVAQQTADSTQQTANAASTPLMRKSSVVPKQKRS